MLVVIILIIVFLVAVNALYVAAEFAAVSVRPSRIRQMADEGSRSASTLLPVLQDPAKLDRYIAACQIGITLSSLVLGAYGQATLPDRVAPAFESLGGMREAAAQSVSAIAVLVFLTATQVIIGELVPKSLALQFPAKVAVLTVVPMRWSLFMFWGLIAVLNGSGLAILRLMKAHHVGHGHVHSPEEIELLIVQSADGGLLEPEERQRLGRALSLSTRSAHSIMVPRNHMDCIDANDPMDQIIQRVADSPYTRLPVYRDLADNVIGILNSKDLTIRLLDGPLAGIDELIRPVVSVPESIGADRLLAILRERGGQQAILIDEFGGVAGLVTLEDILTEVFGDFGDEFKGGDPQPEVLADGQVRIPGRMRMEDAAELVGREWPGHADTVGGRITEALGALPVAGQRVVIDGMEVEVEAVRRRAIVSVVVRPYQAEETADG